MADDHPVFRRGLVALLVANGFDVVAEAASGPEAVQVVALERPDIVLMDGYAELDGLAATGMIVAAHPDIRVPVVSMLDDLHSVQTAFNAGAASYVLKISEPEHIIAAVNAAVMGTVWLGAGVPHPGTEPSPAPESFAGPTRRESAVAELLCRGLGNGSIAERLGVSTKSVANYVSTILLKIGASDRLEAARMLRNRK